jgi:hypothetical protein
VRDSQRRIDAAQKRALDEDAALAYAHYARGERKRPTTRLAEPHTTESDIFRLVAAGLTDDQIGQALLMGNRNSGRLTCRTSCPRLMRTPRTERGPREAHSREIQAPGPAFRAQSGTSAYVPFGRAGRCSSLGVRRARSVR